PSQRVLYAGLVTINELGVYTFNAAGVISFVRTVPNEGVDICWLRTNAAGTRLYSSESLTNTLTVYDTTDALNPVQIQHVTLNAADGPVINIALDPNGNMQSGRRRDPTRQWSGLIRSGAARTSPDFPPHDAIAHREIEQRPQQLNIGLWRERPALVALFGQRPSHRNSLIAAAE